MSPSSPSTAQSRRRSRQEVMAASPSGQPSAWCAEARKYRNTIDIASPAFENVPHLRLRSRQSGLRRRRPGIPRRMLTQLVQQDQITRKTAHCDATPPPPDTGDPVSPPRSGRTMNRFRMPELHIVDQLFQLRFQATTSPTASAHASPRSPNPGGTDHRARLQRIHATTPTRSSGASCHSGVPPARSPCGNGTSVPRDPPATTSKAG